MKVACYSPKPYEKPFFLGLLGFDFRGRIGYLGLDVYEEESDLFFRDLSDQVIRDDLFSRLIAFPNVVVTGHQVFFTREALDAIARTTLENLDDLAADLLCRNQVSSETHVHAPA